MDPTGDVWLVTGAQASGKSTVAELLARHVRRGVHGFGADVATWSAGLRAAARLVVLRPSVEALERRDAARRTATGKVACSDTFTPADDDRALAATDRTLGLWLDTTDQTPEETVRTVLGRAEEARVPAIRRR